MGFNSAFKGLNSKLRGIKVGEQRHVTKFQTLTFNTIPHRLHSLDVEEGSAMVGRAHTQMLAHQEKRPEAVSYSGSGLFCVLQHSLPLPPPCPYTTLACRFNCEQSEVERDGSVGKVYGIIFCVRLHV